MPVSANEKLIVWSKTLMIVAGCWNQPISKNPIITKLFFLYSLGMRICCILFWVFLFLEMLRLIICGYEWEIIIPTLSVVFTDSKVMAKMIIYMKNNILDIIPDMTKKEKEVWASDCKEIKTVYLNKIKFLRIATVAVATTNFLTIFLLELIGTIQKLVYFLIKLVIIIFF